MEEISHFKTRTFDLEESLKGKNQAYLNISKEKDNLVQTMLDLQEA